MDWYEFARSLAGFFVILLFSLCFHEVAHGWVARMRGDPTALVLGRLTMNPMAHLDWTGTVILPLITVFLNSTGAHLPLFGWAKPVPVNERNLKNPRIDMFWIALAGPLANIFLAVVGTAVLLFCAVKFFENGYYTGIQSLLQQFILTNLFLAFFNMIPLHPLDGGKVLARFLTPKMNQTLERHEQATSFLLLAVILLGGMQSLTIPVFWSYNQMIHAALGVLQ